MLTTGMTIKVLTFLAAIVSNFNTLPSDTARAYATWALRHPLGSITLCTADWGGITPDMQLFQVYKASCDQLNSPVLTPADVSTILAALPIDCYPPTPTGCSSPGGGPAQHRRIK